MIDLFDSKIADTIAVIILDSKRDISAHFIGNELLDHDDMRLCVDYSYQNVYFEAKRNIDSE